MRVQGICANMQQAHLPKECFTWPHCPIALGTLVPKNQSLLQTKYSMDLGTVKSALVANGAVVAL